MELTERICAVYAMQTLPLPVRMQLIKSELSSRELLALNTRKLSDVLSIEVQHHTSLLANRFLYDTFLQWLSHRENHFVWFGDQAYPPLLKEISDPPFLLTYVGQLNTHEPVISLVGTTKPSLQAQLAAFSLGLQCADAQTLVVSGFFRGIDSAVHAGTLAHHGKTWAVLGRGLAMLARQGGYVMDRIVDHGGAMISEFHPFSPPRSWQFSLSNRVISALSPITVIIQAPQRSGALATADHALRQGRDVVVVAQGLSGTEGAGGRKLVREGAPVITDLHDIPKPAYAAYFSGRKVTIGCGKYARHLPYQYGKYRFGFR
jgi:DNA processing protein